MKIDLARIQVPAGVAEPIIAEGAGGILVPINDSDLMLDLARHVGFPILIAARSALGTINHTLLTVRALRCAKMCIKGVVMIGDRNKDNERSVEHFGAVPVVGWIPRLDKIDRQVLLQVFRNNLDPKYFSDAA